MIDTVCITGLQKDLDDRIHVKNYDGSITVYGSMAELRDYLCNYDYAESLKVIGLLGILKKDPEISKTYRNVTMNMSLEAD